MYLEYALRGTDLKKQEELDRYVELSVTQNTFTWEYNATTKRHELFKTRVMSTLETCQVGRLQTQPGRKDFLGVNSEYLCPKGNFSFFLNSSFSGETSNFIEFSVRKCN